MNTLLRLLAFVRKYWGLLAIALVCLLGGAASGLVVPWLIREAIDTVVNHGQSSFLILAAGAVVGASALRGLLGYGDVYLAEVISQKAAYDIRNAIYDQLQRLSFAYHDKNQTGQLMSRATVDVEAVRMFLGRGFVDIIETAIMFIATTCILVWLDWKLAVFSLAFVVAISCQTVIVSNILRPIWLRVQQLMGVMSTVLEENLTGVRIVKSFCSQEEESRKFYTQNKLQYDGQIAAARKMAFNMPIMAFLISIPTILVLWYGGRQIIAGQMTIGGLSQFLLYLGMLAMPVRRLGMVTNMVSRSISAGQRVLEILDAKSPIQEKPGAIELNNIEGRVSFENVSFGYDASHPVLNDVSFVVQPGELVALVGSLGSGKSTIAHLIPRFYDATGGTIKIDDIDIHDVTLSSLRRNIGIVQQDIFLFSATIRDNIAYGVTNASVEQIEAVSKAAHLHDFIISLPGGYDTWVGERGITLSGGEKQRLAIARTLLMNPRILILDDSMSSVDAKTEILIRNALNQLIIDRTTFIITHRLSIIKNSNLILVMQEGRVAERGKHEELLAKKGLYSQIYETQLSAFQQVKEELTEEKV